MEDNKIDLLQIILQPYNLKILNELKSHPKRFRDLKIQVTNDRTLSLKLAKLQDYGLVLMIHKKSDDKYANFYAISKKGKDILRKLEDI